MSWDDDQTPSLWTTEIKKGRMGKGGGSIIKIFWSIDLDDLMIQKEWLNTGATFILDDLV